MTEVTTTRGDGLAVIITREEDGWWESFALKLDTDGRYRPLFARQCDGCGTYTSITEAHQAFVQAFDAHYAKESA